MSIGALGLNFNSTVEKQEKIKIDNRGSNSLERVPDRDTIEIRHNGQDKVEISKQASMLKNFGDIIKEKLGIFDNKTNSIEKSNGNYSIEYTDIQNAIKQIDFENPKCENYITDDALPKYNDEEKVIIRKAANELWKTVINKAESYEELTKEQFKFPSAENMDSLECYNNGIKQIDERISSLSTKDLFLEKQELEKQEKTQENQARINEINLEIKKINAEKKQLQNDRRVIASKRDCMYKDTISLLITPYCNLLNQYHSADNLGDEWGSNGLAFFKHYQGKYQFDNPERISKDIVGRIGTLPEFEEFTNSIALTGRPNGDEEKFDNSVKALCKKVREEFNKNAGEQLQVEDIYKKPINVIKLDYKKDNQEYEYRVLKRIVEKDGITREMYWIEQPRAKKDTNTATNISNNAPGITLMYDQNEGKILTIMSSTFKDFAAHR